MDTTHVFKPMNFARHLACVVCKKPFSGFLCSGVKCQGSRMFSACIPYKVMLLCIIIAYLIRLCYYA